MVCTMTHRFTMQQLIRAVHPQRISNARVVPRQTPAPFHTSICDSISGVVERSRGWQSGRDE
jgi:hypothetical protein